MSVAIGKRELDVLEELVSKVNERVIKLSGGAFGYVNEGNLSFALYRALCYASKEGHTRQFHKIWAARTLFEIAKLHPFTDANKRTAYVIAKVILHLGKYDFEVIYEKAKDFLIKIAEKRIKYEEVCRWIEKHSKELTTEPSPDIQEFVNIVSKVINY
jgi:death-on-curing protein